MVRKIVVSLILFTQLAQAASSSLVLRWQGDQSPRCQKLVESFLSELRSMALDKAIELEAVANSSAPSTTDETRRALDLKCDGEAIRISENGHSMLLRYSPKAAGFDATDWLPFQQRFLREESKSLELAALTPKSIAASAQAHTSDSANSVSLAEKQPDAKNEKSLFQRWWFWGIVAGAVGGGIYAVTQSGSKDTAVNVEIQ